MKKGCFSLESTKRYNEQIKKRKFSRTHYKKITPILSKKAQIMTTPTKRKDIVDDICGSCNQIIYR